MQDCETCDTPQGSIIKLSKEHICGACIVQRADIRKLDANIDTERAVDATPEIERGFVLDPFFGAGTTGLVADRLQRDCIGIEINPAYAEMARKRIQGDSTMFELFTKWMQHEQMFQ